MPRLVIGTADAGADMRYAAGFWAPDPQVLLDLGKRGKILVVSALEVGRARATVEGTVWQPEDVVERPADRRRIGHWALGAMRRAGVSKVRVDRFFPLGVARLLESEGIRLEVIEGGLYPERAVKTDRELRCMRQAQRAAVAAMRSARRLIEESEVDSGGALRWNGKPLTSERVREEIDQTLLARACSADDTIVAGGRQGADPHERGHGRLRAGETIIVDIFPRHRDHGYCGDITRTYVKGAVPPRIRALYQAVREAQQVALDTTRAGKTGKQIHRAVEKVFDRHGFARSTSPTGMPEGFFHGTGHGIGLAVHEPPSVSPAGGRLRAGHVVTLEPGLYYADLGGVRIEDTVVVEADGCRPLATLAKGLRVR